MSRMTPDEVLDYVSEVLREQLCKNGIPMSNRATNAAVETMTRGILGELEAQGLVGKSEVRSVQPFETLPPQVQQHLLGLYGRIKDLDTWASELFFLAPEEERWLTIEVAHVPDDLRAAVDAKYRTTTTLENGTVLEGIRMCDEYWDEIQDLEEQYRARVPRDPRGVVLVDFDVVLPYPVDCVKATITFGDKEEP